MIRINSKAAQAQTLKWFDRQEAAALEETQKLTLEILKRNKEQSPVDLGNFRDSWEVVVPERLGQPGIVSNPLPYGPGLADGRSPQARRGWIDLIVRAVALWRGKA